jgi:carbonic anhydrase
MGKLANFFFCGFFIVYLLFASLPKSPEIEDASEFSYDPNSVKGPDHWGELNPDWYACGNGTMQSPIDLRDDRVIVNSGLGMLKRNYTSSNSDLINRGHDIMLNWTDDAGSIVLNGTKYELKQMHWHSPSEHTINGKRFNLEAHLVHESRDGKTAVIGIIYTIGQPDSFLASLEDHLVVISGTSYPEIVGVTDPMNIEMGNSLNYYRYAGSLTTPPCLEGVLWTILTEVRTVSREQLSLLRVPVHDEPNARPVQPLNKRQILLFQDKKKEESIGHAVE